MARPRNLALLIVLPWIASAVLMLSFTRIRDQHMRWHWGLLGSAAICFSIGCLARTSVVIAERSNTASKQSR